MHFHMVPSLIYAPVNAMLKISTLSSLCDEDLSIVVRTESLMPRNPEEAHPRSMKVISIYIVLQEPVL